MTVNGALLASGAPIGEMNVVRKHLSRVKGWQLPRVRFGPLALKQVQRSTQLVL
jgi:glycerate-2-kinase